MIKIIEGNIVNAKTDFIIHQVNCQGEMNTGVAKALSLLALDVIMKWQNLHQNQALVR